MMSEAVEGALHSYGQKGYARNLHLFSTGALRVREFSVGVRNNSHIVSHHCTTYCSLPATETYRVNNNNNMFIIIGSVIIPIFTSQQRPIAVASTFCRLPKTKTPVRPVHVVAGVSCFQSPMLPPS